MRFSTIAMLAALLCGASTAANSQTATVNNFRGMGINVGNVEASIKFYTEVFGFKVAQVFPENVAPKDGREIVLNMTGTFAMDDKQGTSLVLAKLGDKPVMAERTGYGRMIMVTTNAAALEARATAAGYKVTKSAQNANLIFVTDPDGFRIEVFQP